MKTILSFILLISISFPTVNLKDQLCSGSWSNMKYYSDFDRDFNLDDVTEQCQEDDTWLFNIDGICMVNINALKCNDIRDSNFVFNYTIVDDDIIFNLNGEIIDFKLAVVNDTQLILKNYDPLFSNSFPFEQIEFSR